MHEIERHRMQSTGFRSPFKILYPVRIVTYIAPSPSTRHVALLYYFNLVTSFMGSPVYAFLAGFMTGSKT